MNSQNLKKIAIILPSAAGGGAQRTLLKIAASLDRKRFETCIILIDGKGPNIEIIPSDMRLYNLGTKRVSRSGFKLLGLIRSLKPAIIVSTIYHLNILMVFLKPFFHRSTKLVIRESNITSLSLRNTGHGTYLFELLIKLLYPWADRIICLGIEMKQKLVDSFNTPQKKITIIPNPVDLNEIKKCIETEKNPMHSGKYNLLAVGSLTEQKGFDLLLDGIDLVRRDVPDIHLTILGEGPLRSELERMILSMSLNYNVTLAGYRQNPYNYFKYADLFVLSSRYEGLPNVVLEALACGTPVVAFDCPGCLRDIITSSDQGQLVPVGDIRALADAIIAKLNGEDTLKQTVSLPTQFEMSAVMASYSALFHELTEATPRVTK